MERSAAVAAESAVVSQRARVPTWHLFGHSVGAEEEMHISMEAIHIKEGVLFDLFQQQLGTFVGNTCSQRASVDATATPWSRGCRAEALVARSFGRTH